MLPEWADPSELEADVRRDLRGLSKEGAEFVGAHLIAAGTLAEDDPELAWKHARAARSKGGRIAVVRETVGLVAYRAGEWAEAISELRAARRMGGGAGHLAVMADCERAQGNPDKAIELSRSTEAAELDEEAALELRIVVAGARADLGQIDAALVYLEATGLKEESELKPENARLYYAYADLLAKADRTADAVEWFLKAADADIYEETDAGVRLTEMAEDIPHSDLPAGIKEVSAGDEQAEEIGSDQNRDENGDKNSVDDVNKKSVGDSGPIEPDAIPAGGAESEPVGAATSVAAKDAAPKAISKSKRSRFDEESEAADGVAAPGKFDDPQFDDPQFDDSQFDDSQFGDAKVLVSESPVAEAVSGADVEDEKSGHQAQPDVDSAPANLASATVTGDEVTTPKSAKAAKSAKSIKAEKAVNVAAASEPVAVKEESASEPAAESVSAPATESVSESATESAAEPAAESAQSTTGMLFSHGEDGLG